jgi:mannose-6-phosphate isomerase-like protein (cupin superfamily)
MNSPITTLDPVPTPIATKTILSRDGFTCSLLTLAPGDETPQRDAHHVEEHVVYVAEGAATVHFDDMNTMLKKDEALLIPKGKAHVIAAQPGGWAKLLRVEVPPRQVVVPQIISLAP